MNDSKEGRAKQSATLHPFIVPICKLEKQNSVPDSQRRQLQLDEDVTPNKRLAIPMMRDSS